MTRNPVAAGNPGTVADRRSVASPRPALRGAFTALVTPFAADGGSTRPPFARSPSGRSWPGSTASSRSARPARRPPCRPPSATGSSRSRSRPRRPAPHRGAPLVVAGTGTNDTRASIEATRRAAALGADAALVVAPYYNRPDQRMLEAHFRAIADEGGLPIVVYNVPSRTGTNVEADTFLRLAEHPRVTAVKEASGNIEQLAVICRDRPRDVAVLAGDDAATLAVLAMGGDGVVSVAGNQVPGAMAALCAAARAGDWDEAGASTPDGCPCSAPTSRARPTRCRPSPAPRAWRRRRPRARPRRAAGPADHGELLDVAARLLDGGHPRMLRQPQERVGLDVGPRARGNVVDDDRQAAVVRDGPEVGVEHPLVGPVVVGRDDERGVRAEGGRATGRLDRGPGVVGAGAGDDERARARGGTPAAADGDLDEPVALGGATGWAPRRSCRRGRGRRCRPGPAICGERAEGGLVEAPSAVNGVTRAVKAPRGGPRVGGGIGDGAGIPGGEGGYLRSFVGSGWVGCGQAGRR